MSAGTIPYARLVAANCEGEGIVRWRACHSVENFSLQVCVPLVDGAGLL